MTDCAMSSAAAISGTNAEDTVVYGVTVVHFTTLSKPDGGI